MGSLISKLVFIPPNPAYEIQTTDALFKSYIKTKNHTVPVLYLQGRRQPPDQVIIFSHGNAEDLGAVEGWLYELTRICDLFDSPSITLGMATVKAIVVRLWNPLRRQCIIIIYIQYIRYEAINGVYDHLTIHMNPPIPANKIILLGRSLGTGPTVDLASRKPDIKGVILQSPLLSAVRVVMRSLVTLPIDVFASIDKIHKVRVPVFICHGDRDQVINVSHGRRLSEMLPNKVFPPLFLEGAGHNDIESSFQREYSRGLQDFIRYVNTPKEKDNL